MKKNEDKTKEQLVDELAKLRRRVAELETSEAEHEQIEEELKRHNKGLAALNATTATILQSPLDLGEVLQRIADGVVEGFGCNTAVILLLNEQKAIFQGRMVSTKGNITERLSAIIGYPVLQVKAPARADFNEALSNVFAGRITIKHDFYELAGPLLSRPVCSELQRLMDSTTFLGLPLLAKGKVVGGIVASAREEPNERYLETMMTFANQAAMAIENARLYEAERRYSAELEALRQASLHLTSTLELQPILEAILDHAFKLVAAHDVHIFSYLKVETADGERLTFGAALWEDGRQQKPYTKLRPQGLTYTVARSGERIVIPDVNSHPLFRDYQWGGAIIGLPLRIGERVVGVMTVAFEKPHTFDESELRVLELLAAQAAIAVENARLFEETERLKAFNESIVQGTTEGIVVRDVEGRLTYVNPAMTAMLGYSTTELLSRHWATIVPPDQQAVVQAADERHKRGETDRYELQLIHRNGTRVPVLISGSPWLEEGRFAGVLAVLTDITARKRMEEALRALALVDDLTRLYNRRGFFTLVKQQLKLANRAKRGMVLLFADFDGLKQINDIFGHSQGDRALIEVANVLRKKFRESDIIARIGGDEFVVLVTETDGLPAEVFTARLREKLEARNAKGDLRYKLSLSTGIARYDPEHPCSIDELLAQADRAMYEQKQLSVSSLSPDIAHPPAGYEAVPARNSFRNRIRSAN